MRYAYTGEAVPALLPICVYEGYIDRVKHGLLFVEQLYRSPARKRIGYRLGWIAGFMTGAPPRTRRRKP